MIDFATLAAEDRRDPLAPRRDEFLLPAGVVYLDGNSLGPLTRRAAERVGEVMLEQWGESLIRSWNEHGWIELPRRAGAKIARLIGAAPDEVVVADSTSVNLFKVAAAALRARPGRRVIVSEAGNFPTDLYTLEGLLDLLGPGFELRRVEREEIGAALTSEVAALCLTHVDFRTGARHDLAGLTAAAHHVGALAIWDLAHSAGALPVELGVADADLAVGCGYKYLNGGPGAPAFVFAARRLQEELRSPLQGWLGHAAPFEFAGHYRPAPGIDRFQNGTPPVLALAALDAALEVWDGLEMTAVRAKSMALTSRFIELVEAVCAGLGLRLASPRNPEERGSQVSFAHPEAYAVMQALIARGVIGDFRAPDLLRFGFAPLYVGFEDVGRAVAALQEVLATEEWRQERWQQRATVT
ncbi:MAG: kynureninase [Thermoanaerobaculia bacterium]|nr:kynureninase [Thermoanaerobaculia bacterium]